ncbi:MYG1 family protein [Lichenicola cladoniae]|uniref:MYG1 family protein n=1 Tax=Lichenicola cladoniae TaxID=1484109 RepID=A0A6M8HTS3_9PROT|nr:MYG1 family protein [Lichenicola cladoniae]NPD67588.1 MYG1 family protein [Acetobacteraceae bacterium]QKE91768.1 MYG1 family protein [Lichenicola cladoniae]
MTADQPRPLLVTHSGKFHCDEVFAYTVLRLALGLHEPGRDHTLARTRSAGIIESGDIVWDVGARFDAATNRFDHHQRGAPTRPNETPFSSAGLIWQVYGERAVAALMPAGAERFAGQIAADLDSTLVLRIDEIDNGVAVDGPGRDNLGFSTLVGEFNPTWDDPAGSGPTAGDTAFLAATAFAETVLRHRVDGLRARMDAEATVLGAHRSAEDPRLLVLERGMPWKNVVHNHALPVLLTVSPASNGNWMVDTVPPEPGSFAQKLPLSEAWAGLQNDELATISGVPDAVFVHLRRFVGAAKSRDGALAMAQATLARLTSR